MISFSHQTDTGKKRDHNEDFYEFDEQLGLYIVCDGMGGHAAGEVASELACQTAVKFIKSKQKIIQSLQDPSDSPKRRRIVEILKEAVKEANDAVWKTAQEDSSKKGMGTTLVLLLFTKAGVFVAHVGDSRAYLVRGPKVLQLTEDHSLVNEMIKAGIVSKQEALNHPQGNVITQAIGVQKVVTPDVLFYEFVSGDLFFICSDGLHDYFKQGDIFRIVESHGVKNLSHEFVKFANSRGGKDNITCISIQYGKRGAPPAHPSMITATTKMETLKKIPLFASLNFKEMAQVLEVAQVRNIEKGVHIMKEGSTGEDMYIILKGKVDIIAGGNKVAELRPGNFFGEMSLIDRSPRSATVTAASDCKMLRITRSEFFPLLKRESRIGLKVFWSFLQNMNKRLRDNDKIVSNYYSEQEAIPRMEKSGVFDLSSLDNN
jgi:protein phosphatase